MNPVAIAVAFAIGALLAEVAGGVVNPPPCKSAAVQGIAKDVPEQQESNAAISHSAEVPVSQVRPAAAAHLVLTHPLTHDGPWVRSCADFNPCKVYLTAREP